MEYYKTDKITENIFAIKSMTGEILYLIEGSERAVLIDSGLGVGNLRKVVASITHKPLSVLLTHGHVDHAPGAADFDCVYLNLKDRGLYQRHCMPEERMGYLKANLGDSCCVVSKADLVAPDPEKDFLDLTENMEFDLGGLHVEVYEMPGHTKGSVIFLIREPGILILGDACNNATFLFDDESSTVSAYLKVLEETVRRLDGKFHRVFLSHHVMETDAMILKNMIAVCRDVLAGNADDLPFAFMGDQAWIAKKCNERFERADGKSGNLIYSKAKL